ncbi:pleckstrin homology domain-containing family J member 1 isoform X1 [Lutra lutra]|uniref:pleckstrin homology domain-containing family J member 1 isoform X1 n=1 Tax=Lutra lutra TaxID=9657 RepID=UPI001FD264FF|nr:pleckstrin homology domain-containing family J member 1 isoform X1 [Lutra lutra]
MRGSGARKRSGCGSASGTALCNLFGASGDGGREGAVRAPRCGSRQRHALQREGAAGAVPAAGRAGGGAGHAGSQERQRAEKAACEAGGQLSLLLPDGRGRGFLEDPERKYHFACCSEEQCQEWMGALRRASYEFMRRSLIFYRNEIQKMTGKDPLEQFGISEEARFQLGGLKA